MPSFAPAFAAHARAPFTARAAHAARPDARDDATGAGPFGAADAPSSDAPDAVPQADGHP